MMRRAPRRDGRVTIPNETTTTAHEELDMSTTTAGEIAPMFAVCSVDSTVVHVVVIGADYQRRTLCGRTGRLLEKPGVTRASCLRCRRSAEAGA